MSDAMSNEFWSKPKTHDEVPPSLLRLGQGGDDLARLFGGDLCEFHDLADLEVKVDLLSGVHIVFGAGEEDQNFGERVRVDRTDRVLACAYREGSVSAAFDPANRLVVNQYGGRWFEQVNGLTDQKLDRHTRSHDDDCSPTARRLCSRLGSGRRGGLGDGSRCDRDCGGEGECKSAQGHEQPPLMADKAYQPFGRKLNWTAVHIP